MPHHQTLERRDRSGGRRLLVGWLLLLLTTAAAFAQSPDVGELSVEELRRLVVDQQRLLAQQRQQLEGQATMLQQVLERIDQLDRQQGAGAPSQPAAATEAAAAAEPEPAAEQTKEQQAELNLNSRQENVSVSGEFPGSIELPGTAIAIRPGGFVGLNLVQSSDELGISDRFITSSIPVGETVVAGRGGASVSARNSRVSLEVRRGSELGDFRAFVEGDFLGAGVDGSDTFRLRHAFGQYSNLTIGQTWSTFVNPFAGPEDIDLEGINADVLVRQPLARWQSAVRNGKLAVSIEQPVVNVNGGTGRSRYWDVLARLSRSREETSFYVASVVRQLAAEPTGELSSAAVQQAGDLNAFGWGLTGGANFSLPFSRPGDGFQFTATVGEGIARYINDLDAGGGFDGYIDPETGNLEVGFNTGVMVSYRHFWGFSWRNFRTLRSTFTLGLVDVDYPTAVPDDTLKRTVRASANVLWSPLNGVDLGFEALWGRRQNVDGQSGVARQIQFATFYRF